MASRRTARPAWAAALALLCGCSPETATVDPEPEKVSYKSEEYLFGTEGWRDLSREEIWALGVQRLLWRPEEPPEEWTKEMMLERFSIDTRYWDWVLRYTEDE